MADISMGDLRFNITADSSPFVAAIKKSEEAHRAAAQDMGKSFEQASKQAEAAQRNMWDNIGAKTLDTIRKIQSFGKAMGEAFQGGADAAEKFTTDTFNALKDKTEASLRKWIESVPAGIGKFLTATFDVLKGSGAIDLFMDWGGKKIASGLDTWVGKFQQSGFTTKVRDTLVATATAADGLLGNFFDQGKLDAEQKKIEGFADNVKKKLDEMVEGVRTALQKLAGTWDGVSDAVKKAIDALKLRTEGEKFQTELLGKDRGDRTEAQERKRVLDEIGKSYDDLNEKEKKLFDTELQARVDAANDFDNRQREIEQQRQRAQAIQSVTAALERQGQYALANAGRVAGKSAYDRALEQGTAMAEAYGRGRNAGISQDPTVQDAIRRQADLQQTAANIRFNYDLAEAIKQQSAAYDLQTRSLGASAGEAERMKFTQAELNKAVREGVPITDSLRGMIDASASALGRAAQAAADAKERFESFKQVGQTVASSLESAFDKWISGSGFKWKEFINGLQQDLAKLAFKKGIESLLLGTPSTGLSGGLWGMLGNLFGGFRAGGGDVGSNRAYIVGERGPEMFVPRSAGTIVSNQAMQGGGSVPQVINMKIDLTGANGDETIARISATAARQAFAQAVAQSSAMMPGRQRQFQLLGA